MRVSLQNLLNCLQAEANTICLLYNFAQLRHRLNVLQAEAREAKFNASAGGKAARKAVANVAKEREADAAAKQQDSNAKDWLS